jgi:hypothetical protein
MELSHRTATVNAFLAEFEEIGDRIARRLAEEMANPSAETASR